MWCYNAHVQYNTYLVIFNIHTHGQNGRLWLYFTLRSLFTATYIFEALWFCWHRGSGDCPFVYIQYIVYYLSLDRLNEKVNCNLTRSQSHTTMKRFCQFSHYILKYTQFKQHALYRTGTGATQDWESCRVPKKPKKEWDEVLTYYEKLRRQIVQQLKHLLMNDFKVTAPSKMQNIIKRFCVTTTAQHSGCILSNCLEKLPQQ